MIDDLFNLIINKSDEISNEFYEILNKLEFNYTKSMIETYSLSNLQMLKDIIYTLYSLYTDNLKNILMKAKRDELITLYNVCKTFDADTFIPYYKKTIINKYMS